MKRGESECQFPSSTAQGEHKATFGIMGYNPLALKPFIMLLRLIHFDQAFDRIIVNSAIVSCLGFDPSKTKFKHPTTA